MQLKLSKYLRELRKNAKRFERTDINDKEDKSFWGRNLRRVICIIVSIGFVWHLKEGFTQNFVSYASSVLSILIGLFITAIIFSFDKFYHKENIDEKVYEVNVDDTTTNTTKDYVLSTKEIIRSNSKKALWNKQSHTYSKQFAFITGYNIVLCVFTIVVLSFNTLFEKTMATNLHDYHFDFTSLSKETLLNFLVGSLVAIQRFFVLYWITSVVYNTLFIVSSMVNFMTVKIDAE